MSVPMPEKKIARLGSNPIRIGIKAVAPNIATTCWKPRRTVWPAGRRSSGMTSAASVVASLARQTGK